MPHEIVMKRRQINSVMHAVLMQTWELIKTNVDLDFPEDKVVTSFHSRATLLFYWHLFSILYESNGCLKKWDMVSNFAL